MTATNDAHPEIEALARCPGPRREPPAWQGRRPEAAG